MADKVNVKGYTRRKKAKKGDKKHPGTFDSSVNKKALVKREPITRGAQIIGGGDKRKAGEAPKGVKIYGRH